MTTAALFVLISTLSLQTGATACKLVLARNRTMHSLPQKPADAWMTTQGHRQQRCRTMIDKLIACPFQLVGKVHRTRRQTWLRVQWTCWLQVDTVAPLRDAKLQLAKHHHGEDV